MYEPPLEAVAALEPWRQRVGYPETVDDPLWSASAHVECEGEVDWETGSKRWVCLECGYVGWASVTKHYPVLSPKEFFEQCRELYLQGAADPEGANNRMYFVMAAAVKKAATLTPRELRDFVEKLSRL